MAATNTTVGTIALNGDLIAGNANVPTLRPSGVRAGTYDVLSKIYIDAQGRTVWVQEMPEDFAWPIGSKTNHGIIQIGYTPFADNRDVDVDGNSVISLNFATSSNAGVVKLGTGFVKNSTTGKMDVVVTPATSGSYGGVKTGTGGSGIVVDVDGGISVDMNDWPHQGLLARSTSSVFGVVEEGTGFDISSGILSVNPSELTWPTASTSILGFVKDGTRLTIDGSGVLSVDMNPATTSEFGFIKLGSGFEINAGVLTTSIANGTTPGTVTLSNEFSAPAGHLTLNNATTSSYGQVTGHGTNIAIDANGVISCDVVITTIPVASTTVFGKMQVGSSLAINAGVLSLDIPTIISTPSVLGLVKIGSNVGVDDDGSGSISLNTSYIPTATSSIPGMIKTGTTISNNGAGLISVSNLTLNIASTTAFGGIKIDTTVHPGGVMMDMLGNTAPNTDPVFSIAGDGTLTADQQALLSYTPFATASTVGKIRIFGSTNRFTINENNELCVDPSKFIATASVLGAVKLGAGLSSSSGVVSIDAPLVAQSNTFNGGQYSNKNSYTISASPMTVNLTNQGVVTYFEFQDSPVISTMNLTVNFYPDKVNSTTTNDVGFMYGNSCYIVIKGKLNFIGNKINTTINGQGLGQLEDGQYYVVEYRPRLSTGSGQPAPNGTYFQQYGSPGTNFY